MDHDRLIDRIYEAAIVPDLWDGILQDVSEMAGCYGAVFSTTASTDNVGRWISSPAVRDLMEDFARDSELQANNLWLQRAMAAKHHGFVGNDKLYGSEELERNLSYSKFFYPRGLGYCAGTVIPMPNGDIAVFNLERRHSDGPVPDDKIAALDGIRPHLGRAAVIATRLNLERANSVVEALGTAGLAAAVLAKGGRVIAANERLEGLSEQFMILAHDKIAAADRRANTLLGAALEQISSAATTRSIPIPSSSGSPSAVAHILPLPGEAADIFFCAQALLVVTQLDRPSAPAAELLGGLFDLTPTEARVARCIAEGKSTEEAASALKLTRETVRWYLKAIFAKTGVSRQAELSALLAGAVLHGGKRT